MRTTGPQPQGFDRSAHRWPSTTAVSTAGPQPPRSDRGEHRWTSTAEERQMERKVECQTEAPRKPGPVSSLVALLSNPPGSNLKLRAFNHCAFTLVAPTLHVSSCHVLGTGPAPFPPASKGFRVSCRLPRLFFFRFWDSSFCGWSPGPATYFFPLALTAVF